MIFDLHFSFFLSKSTTYTRHVKITEYVIDSRYQSAGRYPHLSKKKNCLCTESKTLFKKPRQERPFADLPKETLCQTNRQWNERVWYRRTSQIRNSRPTGWENSTHAVSQKTRNSATKVLICRDDDETKTLVLFTAYVRNWLTFKKTTETWIYLSWVSKFKNLFFDTRDAQSRCDKDNQYRARCDMIGKPPCIDKSEQISVRLDLSGKATEEIANNSSQSKMNGWTCIFTLSQQTLRLSYRLMKWLVNAHIWINSLRHCFISLCAEIC